MAGWGRRLFEPAKTFLKARRRAFREVAPFVAVTIKR
jgi:hypothetical protein